MIHYSVGKEILDALFNIELYGDKDLAQKMKDKNGITYKPVFYGNDTKLVGKYPEGASGIEKNAFDLQKNLDLYFDYDTYTKNELVGDEYEETECCVLKEKEPNTIEFGSDRNCYVGLFTSMPMFWKETDKDGNPIGEPKMYWEEPWGIRGVPSQGTVTETYTGNYHRINLHRGIISDDAALNTATNDKETGAAVVDNKELIAFPESFGEGENKDQGWGEIYGFGIFTEPEGNDSPILWGRLQKPVTAQNSQVPLFRENEFKIILE